MPHKIIISGGGTGGHIFPAVAIAKEIQKRFPDSQFLFIGANGRMEMEKIPQEGFEIIGLDVAGLKRSLSLQNFVVIFKFIQSYFKAKKIVKSFKPNVVIGTGGYASLAVLYAAQRNHYPTVIWEGNGYAGLSNKILSKRAKTICTGLPQMEKFFPAEKIVFTGNPVRNEILKPVSKTEAAAFFQLNENHPIVFITGGSLGAKTINQAIQNGLELFHNHRIQLIWQTGKNFNAVNHFSEMRIFPFLREMNMAYAAADLVISRAGALSIAEITVTGKPSVLVPSPNVTEDHQTQNALKLTNENAAVLVKDSEAIEKLPEVIISLLADKDRCQSMREKLIQLQRPNATSAIVDEIEKVWTA